MGKLYLLIILTGSIIASAAFIPISQKNNEYKIEYPSYFGNKVYIPSDNPTTEAGVKLGRYLFYETALSANNKISCSSCHQQKLAFTDGQKSSIGVDGSLQSRNTMSLANLLWVSNLFWDGRSNSLEDQAKGPLTNTHEMGQAISISALKLQSTKLYPSLFKAAFNTSKISDELIVKALAQFERTLVSANSKYDQYLNGTYQPNASELNGIQLFYSNNTTVTRGASCGRCHGGPKTYANLFHNNGLDSIYTDKGRSSITNQAYDLGRFRVVTLRNIALTAPYMHDGRFKNLEEVIDHYDNHIKESETLSPILRNNDYKKLSLHLSITEKKDLLSFLNMLTDSSFINDKRFSSPFKK